MKNARFWAGAAGFMALVAAASTPARAQDFVMRRPSPPPANTDIIGGRASILSEWPATLAVTGSASGECTATVVGPRVIMTAAHCVRRTARGVVQWSGDVVNVACERHPRYRGGRDFDVALCVVAAELKFVNGDAPERLSVRLGPPALNAVLLLQGYGCRRVGGDGPSGVLFEGEARVDAAPAAETTFTTSGGAAVCFGDSGGAAYQVTGLRRRVVGVNARGDIVQRSWLTDVAHAEVQTFFQSWMAQKRVKICGLSDDLDQCRA